MIEVSISSLDRAVTAYVIDFAAAQQLADVVSPLEVKQTIRPSHGAPGTPVTLPASAAPAPAQEKPARAKKAAKKPASAPAAAAAAPAGGGIVCPVCGGTGAARRFKHCAACWEKLSPARQGEIKAAAAARKAKPAPAAKVEPTIEPAE